MSHEGHCFSIYVFFFFFRHHSIITSVFASYTSKWMTCGKNPEPGHITSLDHDNFSLSNLSMDLLFTFFLPPESTIYFLSILPWSNSWLPDQRGQQVNVLATMLLQFLALKYPGHMYRCVSHIMLQGVDNTSFNGTLIVSAVLSCDSSCQEPCLGPVIGRHLLTYMLPT